MSKNSKHKKMNIKKTPDTITLIKSWTVSVYAFLMLAVFVLYAPQKYIYIGNHKIAFFEKVTGVFLIVAFILFIISFIISIRKKEKIKFNLSFHESALLLYGIWNLISFAFSPYKRGALFGYEGWHTGLYMQLALIIVFFTILRWKNKTDLKAI